METPIELNVKLEVIRTERMGNKEQYQRLVGKLIYLSHTWPDIASAVTVVSQFMHSPTDEQLKQFGKSLNI